MPVCESSLVPIDDNDMRTQYGFPSHEIASSIDQHSAQHGSDEVQALGINVAQYNCQTMLKANFRASLLESIRYCKIGILALQETRINSAGASIVEDFVSCRSSAISGNHGCEILIHTKTPWFLEGDSNVCINVDDVSIVMHSDRYIVVHVTITHNSCYIICTHAPYQGCDEDPVQWLLDFFAEFRKRVPRSSCIVCCGDFNCQLSDSNKLDLGDMCPRKKPPQP